MTKSVIEDDLGAGTVLRGDPAGVEVAIDAIVETGSPSVRQEGTAASETETLVAGAMIPETGTKSTIDAAVLGLGLGIEMTGGEATVLALAAVIVRRKSALAAATEYVLPPLLSELPHWSTGN